MPPSGGGGCHTAILGAANRGIKAGLDPQRIFDDLRQNITGTRRVSDQEIMQAIEKAQVDKGQNCGQYDFKQQPEKKPAFDGEAARWRIIEGGAGATEADIWDASPIRIDWPPEEDPQHLLAYLYRSTDLIFIGKRYSPGILNKTIRTASDWIKYFQAGGKTSPHIIPNPLSGNQGLTGSGKQSLRADSCIKSFKLAVVEFDGLSREDQLAFWWSVRLPVVCLLDSGNKSLHGWIRIDNTTTAEQWTDQVENSLFRQLLEPLGIDGACRNEARLSRLPGHQRKEKGMQRLLYLAPKGRRISR